MEAILDFSRPVDVPILDAVVAVFNDAANPQRTVADALLSQFRDHPDAWTRVDTILSESKLHQTKYVALQILETLVKYRWRTLSKEQREGIRSYIVQKIITLSSDAAILAAESVLINKMNLVLVGILKHDWPFNWPSFVPDLVGASKTSEVLCENNVTILRLLSEEVFDFSKETMTAARAEALKASLKTEFQQIFDLLMFILEASTRKSLVVATLSCLQRYVSWIPAQYIFETPLLEVLCMKFLPVPEFRVPTLQVLTELSGLSLPQYATVFELLYMGVMGQIVRVIPPDVNIKRAYAAAAEAGDEDSMLFVRHLALFLTTYLRTHGELLEADAYREALLSGLGYVVQISDVDEIEVFKICVEYWLRVSSDLYALETVYNPALPAIRPDEGALDGLGAVSAQQHQLALQHAAAAAGAKTGSTAVVATAAGGNPRKALYAEVLARVREVMIRHFAKPEEVLIEQDDAGEVVREAQKDTDVIAQYRVMKDAMVFLTHLDPRNTEELMLEKLAKQVNGEEWGYDPLNTLCWAIGSISGTMSEQGEKNFLVTVIKDLLLLCETKKGKNNKAVIASNIMYVVGQYPRFLRAHWKFLRTVVVKLFEFMHEKHPGVQDMAVDTFLKIAQKCKRRFVQVQYAETRPFVDELCAGLLPAAISDLAPHQVYTFYEGAGSMVSAFPDDAARQASTARLMALPNAAWARVLAAAGASLEALKAPDTLKELQRVLRTNIAACRAIGSSYSAQVGSMFHDMMILYGSLAAFVSAAVAAHGPGVMATHVLKCMTDVKRDTLALVGVYVAAAESPDFVAAHFVPPLLEPVLGDYAAAAPVAREAAVLTLMADVVNKLRGAVADAAPRILAAVFAPTLAMVTADAAGTEFPEHRTAFFRLLQAVNEHCAGALLGAGAGGQQLRLVVDAVLWAVRHSCRETGETGLAILQQLFVNVAACGAAAAQPFYAEHLLTVLTELLQVLTDRLHKAHFKAHTTILRSLFQLVVSGGVSAPLWESPVAVANGAAALYAAGLAALAAAPSNVAFVQLYVRTWIGGTFSNLTPTQAQAFVDGLFDQTRDIKAYKSHLRDFLIEVLEMQGGEGEGDLFSEEKAAAAALADEQRRVVPGLANPWDVLPTDYKTVDTADIDEL